MELNSGSSDARPGSRRLGLPEFLLLPDDGKRYEILDGELYVSPSPNTKHQKLVTRLLYALYGSLELTGRGSVFTAPYDVVLARHDVVEPDLIFVSQERLGIIGERRIAGAPDLLVEVLSKRTAARDRRLKSRRYEKAGVANYWIVDPFKDALEVFQLEGKAYRQVIALRSPQKYECPDFGGFTIDLKKLFAK